MAETAIVTPAAWAESTLAEIITSTTQTDFDNAFTAFVSPDVQITLNGQSQTLTEYKEIFQNEKVGEQSAQVAYAGTVELISDLKNPGVSGGLVGFFGNGTIYNEVSGVKSTHTIATSLQLVITSDGNDPTSRKVVSMNEVVVIQSNPSSA